MEFNSLPSEVHLEIFSYLPVRDVMSIRRVCKLWNGLINAEVKFKRLTCYQFLKPGQGISSYDFHLTFVRSFLNYTSANLKFSRVHHLCAYLHPKLFELQDAFDFFNSFKFLKRASFECFVCDHRNEVAEVQKQVVVSLQHLERVNFRFSIRYLSRRPKVLLDLPSLLCLSIDSLTGVTVSHPEKLMTLATYSLFRTEQNYSLFTSLTNIFIGSDDVRSISPSFLENLPSLRELHCGYGSVPANYRLPKLSLEKANPKIFYFGFEVNFREIESEGRIWPNSIRFDSTGASARFIARYFHRSVKNNRFVFSIAYNPIAGQLKDAELFGVRQKFPYISHLRINGTVADPNRLLKFINKLRVRNVTFDSTSLPASFFAKFAKNRPFILLLEIREPTMSILSGDFDFVFQLKNLSSIQLVNCPLSLNFVARTVKDQKYFTSLTIDLPSGYKFSLRSLRSPQNVGSPNVEIYVTGSPYFPYFGYQIRIEEAPNFLNALHNHLNVDGAVCLKELQILLRHLKFENENALFWIRKYLYDQRHSICLSEELMRQLNLYR